MTRDSDDQRGRCRHAVRGSSILCQLGAHHSGPHASVTYECVECGQTFRGHHGIVHHRDAPDGSPYALSWCLPCAKKTGQWWPR